MLKMAWDSRHEEPVPSDVALLLGVGFCVVSGGWLVGLSAVCWWWGSDVGGLVIEEDVVVVVVVVVGQDISG